MYRVSIGHCRICVCNEFGFYEEKLEFKNKSKAIKKHFYGIIILFRNNNKNTNISRYNNAQRDVKYKCTKKMKVIFFPL